MALSNLLVPNNIDIFCGSISPSSVITDDGFTYTLTATALTPSNSTAPVYFYTLNIPIQNGIYLAEFTVYCYVYIGTVGAGIYQNLAFILTTTNGATTIGQVKTIQTKYNGYFNTPTSIGLGATVSNPNINFYVQSQYTGANPAIWYIQGTISGPLVAPS